MGALAARISTTTNTMRIIIGMIVFLFPVTTMSLKLFID